MDAETLLIDTRKDIRIADARFDEARKSLAEVSERAANAMSELQHVERSMAVLPSPATPLSSPSPVSVEKAKLALLSVQRLQEVSADTAGIIKALRKRMRVLDKMLANVSDKQEK